MELVYNLLVVVHLIGMAALVGGWLANIRSPKLTPLMVHGALTQLVTGLLLVGMLESGALGDEGPVNHAKIGVKLTIAVIVGVLAWINRKKENVPANTVNLIGGLGVLNVVVAAMWH